MFECTPFKLSKYIFTESNKEDEKIEKNEIENSNIINEKKEELEVYETSLNSSHNSISSSHYSSERNSLNENNDFGNIKETSESLIDISKANIQEEM